MYKGRALVWLHKLDDEGDCEVTLSSWRFYDNTRCTVIGDVNDMLVCNYWDHYTATLKRMKPGDWVRFPIKWTLCYDSWTDYWSGATEFDVSVDFERGPTLARGHYKEPYR